MGIAAYVAVRWDIHIKNGSQTSSANHFIYCQQGKLIFFVIWWCAATRWFWITGRLWIANWLRVAHWFRVANWLRRTVRLEITKEETAAYGLDFAAI